VATARTYRETNRDLPLSRHRAGQQHIRHVTARNDQEQAHRTEQRVHHGTEIANDEVDQFRHLDSSVWRIGVGMFGGATRRNHRELRLGLTERHTWTQARPEPPRRRIRLRIVSPLEG
jgi:hypothetical protein